MVYLCSSPEIPFYDLKIEFKIQVTQIGTLWPKVLFKGSLIYLAGAVFVSSVKPHLPSPLFELLERLGVCSGCDGAFTAPLPGMAITCRC